MTRKFSVPFQIWAALPLLVAAVLRIHAIGVPEPFVDESGNILIAHDSRIASLLDPVGQGRPLLAILYLPTAWWPDHAVTVARLMSAIAGLVTMVALGWGLHRMAGRGAALAGLWLWALMPFAVFHERLALQDAHVAMALAWAAALLIQGCLAEESRAARWFFGAGLAFSFALLSKISAVLALPWLGLLYLTLQWQRARPIFSRGLLWIGCAALLPLLIMGRDLPHFGYQTFHSGTLPAFAANDFWPLVLERLRVWAGWTAGYGGWPLGVLVLVALFFAARSRSRLAIGCAAGAMLAFFIAALFYNRPFARYVMPDQLPLILFIALSWNVAFTSCSQPLRRVLSALFALVLIPWGLTSRRISTDPLRAPIPADEIAQYFTGPWSANGMAEVKSYLRDYSDRYQVRCLVVTHWFARPGTYALMLAELTDARITVLPFTVYEPAQLAIAIRSIQSLRDPRAFACFLLYEGSQYPAPAWLDQPGSHVLRTKQVPHTGDEMFSLYRFDPE